MAKPCQSRGLNDRGRFRCRGVLLVMLALVASGGVVFQIAAQDVEPTKFYWTRFWQVPPDYWKTDKKARLPEDVVMPHGCDFGIAISGGGTRSAAAAVGQLRGLEHNGWLERACYLSVVSGGSWAAVPFTFSRVEIGTLLGPVQHPRNLTRAIAAQEPPEGSLAHSIVNSELFAQGLRETARILTGGGIEEQYQSGRMASFFRRFVGTPDQTYANILNRWLILPTVPAAENRPWYALNQSHVDDILRLNPSLRAAEWVTATPGRPFLVVGATLILEHPAYSYPRLIPIEYTPLYTGVRQQFGRRVGGTYVWPFAYGSDDADVVDGDAVRVRTKDDGQFFGLDDVIASSGAAPLLSLFLGDFGDVSSALRRGLEVDVAEYTRRTTEYFPSFEHFALRPREESGPLQVKAPVRLLHGDGGFTDNIGLMPLLARQVKNVLVFVNDQRAADENLSIESFFRRLDIRDGGADRSMNVVFSGHRRVELLEGLEKAGAKSTALYCGQNWNVQGNELYNIRPYKVRNICWVYLQPTPAWRQELPLETQALWSSSDFEDFPWFGTFADLRLNATQVSLLANLTTWNIVNRDSRETIEQSFPHVFGTP